MAPEQREKLVKHLVTRFLFSTLSIDGRGQGEGDSSVYSISHQGRRGVLLFVFFVFLTLLSSCGSGGTEVGNPVPAPSAAPSGDTANPQSPGVSIPEPAAVPENPPVKKILPHPIQQITPTTPNKTLTLEEDKATQEEEVKQELEEVEENIKETLEE
ncbi:MAG: hypothetical protein HQM15_05010 [Deltaproteobacteria bacterium]|nr:hypothetical protein [Deltaproteobacteria bacterium]